MILLLTTEDELTDYRTGKEIRWRQIPYNRKRLRNCIEGFIYFNGKGIHVKYELMNCDKRLQFRVVEIINSPITIQILREEGIIHQNHTLQGSRFYLNDTRSNLINELWREAVKRDQSSY